MQSTEVQQPVDLSANLNDQQSDNQPSSTNQHQSHEDAQPPYDDAGGV